MNVSNLVEHAREIASFQHVDPARAEQERAQLFKQTLEAIASGTDSPQLLAAAVL